MRRKKRENWNEPTSQKEGWKNKEERKKRRAEKMPANGDGRREIDLIFLLSLTHGDVNGTDDSIG